jgi:hypothetical protein
MGRVAAKGLKIDFSFYCQKISKLQNQGFSVFVFSYCRKILISNQQAMFKVSLNLM